MPTNKQINKDKQNVENLLAYSKIYYKLVKISLDSHGREEFISKIYQMIAWFSTNFI